MLSVKSFESSARSLEAIRKGEKVYDERAEQGGTPRQACASMDVASKEGQGAGPPPQAWRGRTDWRRAARQRQQSFQ